jgi:hypothetical protein
MSTALVRRDGALVALKSIPRTHKPKTVAFAAQTRVSVTDSMSELRDMLDAHGAVGIAMQHDETHQAACVAFKLNDQQFTLTAPLPRRPGLADADDVLEDLPGLVYSYEARCRERWRALVLWTKGALEMVRLKMLTAEKAFAPARRLGR